jgi:hypothetical protein
MTLRADSVDGWVRRVDRGELLSSHVRPDGSLLCEGYAAREGILIYRDSSGKETRELVLAETLKDSAATLGRAPVTLGHPARDVTPDNVQDLGVGDVDGEIAMADGFVRVKLAVRRSDAIQAIRSGTRELSCGYAVQLDPTPGTHPRYGRYDCTQVRRTTNHLALVDSARAGHECAVRVDSAVATTVIRADSTGTPPATTNQGQRARGGTVDPLIAQMLARLGITQRADDDQSGLRLIDAEIARRGDASNGAATAHKAALDAAHAERDAAKARADAAEAKVKALEDAEKARADKADRERLDGIATAIGLDPKAHADTKALRKAIAEKHLGGALRADATDAYVDVLVDLAAQGREQRGDGRDAGRQVWDSAPAQGSQQAQTPAGQRIDSAPRKGGSLFERAKRRNDSARSEGGEA